MSDDPLGSLGEILGLQVRLAHGAIQRDFAERAAGLGLTQKQISVLWLIAELPGVAQADLARRLQMDRATTMALVHALERRGFVDRAPVAGDARRRGFAATDAGRAALAMSRAVIAEHERWLRSRFSAADETTLRSLLARIHRPEA